MRICVDDKGIFVHETTKNQLTEQEKLRIVACVNACEEIPTKHFNKIWVGFYETYKSPYGMGNLYSSSELEELYNADFKAGRRKSKY